MPSFDDKIYMLNNRYDGIALGYQRWFKKSYLNYSKQLFSIIFQNIILIFTQIRTAFLSNYKNIVLIFNLSLIRAAFLLYCFSIYKIVDSEYSPDNNKSSKINIGAIIKNPQMLKFVRERNS